MAKQFFPNLEFNRKRRSKLLIFYLLFLFLAGGFGIYLFSSGQATLGLLMIGLVAIILTMIPSGLQQYPVKYKPLITIEGKTVTFGANETIRATDVLAVSILMEVPVVSKIKKENHDYLIKVASSKPEEPVLGACDVTIKNHKGKEIIKYAIIDDCIGALEAFLEMGVKKYRILYSQKKETQEALYPMTATENTEAQMISTMSEKEKLDQIF